jgi:hypothetical protein
MSAATASPVQANLLRPPTSANYNHGELVVQDSLGLPSFPESPLLEFRDSFGTWIERSWLKAGKWTGNVEERLVMFLNMRRHDAGSACNVFLGIALKLLYGIGDFEFPGLSGRFLEANAIAHYVSQHPEQWTLLGSASSQPVLERAQLLANLNKPVIAVYSATPHGHVAVVLPGTLQYSSQWNLNVPNSASTFLRRPQKSYVGLTLANAFQAADLAKVKIYGRSQQS